MIIELTEHVHETYCPKGTKGVLENGKIFPDPLPDDCPWENGIYIGQAKYKIIHIAVDPAISR